MMRCFAALQTCLALLLAFFVAPFQHVHTGPDSDHGHAGLIHAHFYNVHSNSVSGFVEEHQGRQLVDSDDHATARALDTFTLVLTTGLSPFIPSLGGVFPFVLSDTFQPVEVVEERGHDPPCLDRSIPRAPPA